MAEETKTDTTGTETSETTQTSDAGGTDASKAATSTDAGDSGNATDQSTVLGSADAGDGAGDAGSDGKADSKADASDGKDSDQKDGADGLPEKYDITLTVKDAEGKDQKVELDPALVDAADPVFRELGLGNEQVNKLAPLVLKVQERMEQQQQDAFSAVRADWAKQAEADPDIGGKNWKESQALAARALDAFGGEKGSAFRQLLDDTGLGNHPDAIRMFRDIGKAVGEDGMFARGDAKPAKKSREEELYPDDVPKK